MFLFKKTLLVVVCVTATMSGAPVMEGCFKPRPNPTRERMLRIKEFDNRSPHAHGIKKTKAGSKPLCSPAKILRKFSSVVRGSVTESTAGFSATH